jgi:hypothetical protein
LPVRRKTGTPSQAPVVDVRGERDERLGSERAACR